MTGINFEKIIESVGQSVSARLPDGWSSESYRAVIQPLRYKNKMYLEGERTQIGRHHPGYYLYIGPARHDLTKLSEGARIRAESGEYTIDRAEKCYLGDTVTHIWAILRSTEAQI